MRNTLHERNRKPSVHVLDKVRSTVIYRAKLEGFRDKLLAHRTSMSVIQELIRGESQSERRASILKLDELVESHERQEEKQELHDRAQEEVVKTFEELRPCTENAHRLSTCEVIEQLEDGLIAKGMSPEQVDEQLFPITKALLLQPLSTSSGRDPMIPKPAFRLDVFESASGAKATRGLRESADMDISEFEETGPTTGGREL